MFDGCELCDRAADFFFGHRHDLVDEPLNQIEGDGVGIRIAGEAVRQRRAWNDFYQVAGAAARLERARCGGFDADDAASRADRFGDRRDAADEATADRKSTRL